MVNKNKALFLISYICCAFIAYNVYSEVTLNVHADKYLFEDLQERTETVTIFKNNPTYRDIKQAIIRDVRPVSKFQIMYEDPNQPGSSINLNEDLAGRNTKSRGEFWDSVGNYLNVFLTTEMAPGAMGYKKGFMGRLKPTE